MERGNHQVTWDAEKNSSGVYFINYQLDNDLQEQRKITLLK
jgi:hypothetical protein